MIELDPLSLEKQSVVWQVSIFCKIQNFHKIKEYNKFHFRCARYPDTSQLLIQKILVGEKILSILKISKVRSFLHHRDSLISRLRESDNWRNWRIKHWFSLLSWNLPLLKVRLQIRNFAIKHEVFISLNKFLEPTSSFD